MSTEPPALATAHAASVAIARRHVRDILDLALLHTADRAAVVVWDDGCALARILADAYRLCLPEATHLDFAATPPETTMEVLRALQPGALVVLIQSTSFRLEAFRIRVELFKRGLKVIEHPHLARMRPDEHAIYVDALAYDRAYYHGVGAALKARIDRAGAAVVDSGGGARLVYDAGFEPAKLNIGDYAALKNVGGQFPIGEVFTEPKDLEAVTGEARIFAFGDTAFHVNAPPAPITLSIRRGRVVDVLDSTPDFDRVIAQIKADEDVWIRELGFGMNRAFTRERRVSDVGSYERMCGVHLSLGAKHGVYNKPGLKRKDAKYHVDVFVVTEAVFLDGARVFEAGAWGA